MIISLILEQLFVWYRLQKHIEYPGFVYLLFPLWGIYCYFRRKKSSGELAPVYKALFWFGSITSLFLLLAAFTASNTMLYESADYMAIGMLVSLCYAERETSESPVFWKSFVLLFVGLAVIHKGFLLYNIYGHDTIFVTRQKAEEGPMAGIYGRYSDGYEYNIRGRLLDEFIPRGSKVLIASHKSIMYLQEDYVICNYSTISTPTIDERLFQYWTLYPDKVPEYIVWDKGSEGYIATNPEVNARLVEKAEEGPMAGIYGRYSDGYEYNIRGRLLDEFIPRGSKVLIASHKSIMYLQEDYVICNYSTISTPTIDERLFQYWTLYPDKVPEYIVWDKGSEGYIATNPEVNARLVENAELLVDDEGLLIYRLPANPY